jgi:hypothetical protein
MATRSACLAVSLTLVLSACLPDPPSSGDADGDGDGDGKADGMGPDGTPSPKWGRLATPGFDGAPIKATLYFPGQARDGSMWYEYSSLANLELYTENPAKLFELKWSEVDYAEEDWTQEMNVRTVTLGEMMDVGVNVLYLSDWGPRGTDGWAKWAPMQSSTFAQDELLSAIGTRSLLTIPFIESNPDWSFRTEFTGSTSTPAPQLVKHIEDIIDRIILHPDKPNWPDHWAMVYGTDGVPRRALAIIHASSMSAMDDQRYVDGLDAVADQVEEDTGERIGFLLDAMPPNSRAPGKFFPTPANTALAMSRSSSILGISNFIPEIWANVGDDPDDGKRIAWKRDFTRSWVESGVPTLVDVAPGYDASKVFPTEPRFGHGVAWREAATDLVAEFGQDGIVLNSWNGYTEAMVIVPTAERGNAAYMWAKMLTTKLPPP